MKRTEILALGHTPELIAHIEQQIPDLLEETKKRLQFDPFYEGLDDSHYIVKRRTPDGAEAIIAYLLSSLGRDSKFLDENCMADLWDTKTLIWQDRIGEHAPDARILIRGDLRPVADMPLYVESGPYGAKSVFPLFDWSELQIKVAAMYIDELVTKLNANHKSFHIEGTLIQAGSYTNTGEQT